MSDASLALQKAIVAALKADAHLKVLIGDPPRIYDDPPRDAPFPYVTIGASTLADWDTSEAPGFEHAILLHAWSRYGGRREARLIQGALHAALHERALSLDGHRLANLRFEFADVFRDEDGETAHAVMRFRAVTEPNL